jgi:hypothetical protein
VEAPAELRALVVAILPEDWRAGLSLALQPAQLTVSSRDANGAARTLDLRRGSPDTPSLVPGRDLAYAYVAQPGETVSDQQIAAIRRVLAAFADREADLAPWLLEERHDSAAHSLSSRGPEFLAFTLGLKPAVRVVLASADDAPALAALVRAAGAGFYFTDPPLHVGHGPSWVGYVARTDPDAKAIADLEAPPDADGMRFADNDPDANARVGAALGYPSCCTSEFARRIAGGVCLAPDGHLATEDYAAAAWAARATRQPHWSLNNLLADRDQPRLVTWLPCSYDCEPSRRFAEALWHAVAERDPVSAARWRDALATRVGIDRHGGRWSDGDAVENVCWVDFRLPSA